MHQDHEETSHVQAEAEVGDLQRPDSSMQRRRSRHTAWKSLDAKDGRATSTTATGPGTSCCCRRYASRIRRRARLRTTEPPTLRLVTMPRRLVSPSGSRRQFTIRHPQTRRVPSVRVLANSRDPCSRCRRPSRSRGRVGDTGTGQTAVKRFRPLLRRALMTLRPPRVDMRARNPSWRLRRIFDGWYWRFMLEMGPHRRLQGHPLSRRPPASP